ncbi:MAG: MiaB/RimO family radical SAM methylthiotransferase, partial [Sedimentisphaerales bacterium]|nr:MiaB/RimO family radical SAM methylthiotransferase [Sedimentisphaerales bacterium]
MDKKILIKSFGCQMNKLDTAMVTSALKKDGFAQTDTLAEANVVLINTCSVRQHAEERVFSHLGHLKHARKANPALVVAVIGCMAQRLGDELLKHTAVDIVCGPGQLDGLPALIGQTLEHRAKHLAVSAKIREKMTDENARIMEEFELGNDLTEEQLPAQAFVRAMRGCNKFCTYCVVPYVRGPEASRPPKVIIEQIKTLAAQGVKLVTLLGQTINSYNYTGSVVEWQPPQVDGESPNHRPPVGRSLPPNSRTYHLADLLKMASEIDGIEWIRFITSYPADFDEEILHAMAELPKVCRYLHIPAQSGSDRILKAMNRNYTIAEYLELLAKARQIVPDIAIAGDLIVGFPGETDEDFEATVDLLRKAEYKNSFIFKYSPRPGTHADKKLEDNISAEIKKQRNMRLLEVQN